MKIRLGYVAISTTLDGITSSSSFSYTNYQKSDNPFEKLQEVIVSNFLDLEKIIFYNIKNNIHFYRLTSKLIPLSTLEAVSFDYITPYLNYYQNIGAMIVSNNMRVDVHPDQFAVLNSTKTEVVRNTFAILEYHYRILTAFGIRPLIILHVGSSVFGKKKSMERFIKNFYDLPIYLRESIAIENDDKVYNIDDCLYLSKVLKIPVVLDYHHHLCNPSDKDIDLYYEDIFNSWKYVGMRPKIHFSSPKNHTKKERRSHHDYIDLDSFLSFLKCIKNLSFDLDIMLEAKAKDEALFRLIRGIKYKTNLTFLDETSFILDESF